MNKILRFGKLYKKRIFIFLISVLSLIVFYFFLYLQPSNTRNWEFGFQTLPEFSIQQNTISVKNIRNYQLINGNIQPEYLNQTFDTNNLEKVWFVVEPFSIKPFTNFKGVAHTYFVFDFKNQEPIVISVEARREQAEKYDSWIGLFNQYELIYVWGTEHDQTVKRVISENNRLFMYPLNISKTNSQNLFLQLALASKSLETSPRFYNTFTSNCTNELAKAANNVRSGSIPLNKALFLPGYSAEELYNLGYISNDLTLTATKNKYEITTLVRELYLQPDFSKKLREKLI